MVAAIGPPTAFATFSSADTRWEDMEDLFLSYVDIKFNEFVCFLCAFERFS